MKTIFPYKGRQVEIVRAYDSEGKRRLAVFINGTGFSYSWKLQQPMTPPVYAQSLIDAMPDAPVDQDFDGELSRTAPDHEPDTSESRAYQPGEVKLVIRKVAPPPQETDHETEPLPVATVRVEPDPPPEPEPDPESKPETESEPDDEQPRHRPGEIHWFPKHWSGLYQISWSLQKKMTSPIPITSPVRMVSPWSSASSQYGTGKGAWLMQLLLTSWLSFLRRRKQNEFSTLLEQGSKTVKWVLAVDSPNKKRLRQLFTRRHLELSTPLALVVHPWSRHPGRTRTAP
jgi:hypothetical protein